MIKNKHLLIPVMLLFLPLFSLAVSCPYVEMEQITKNVVCNGAPFTIRINFNSNNDYIFLKLYGSQGINFYDFPEKDLRSLNEDSIDFRVSCMNIDKGTIEAKFTKSNGELCEASLKLYNLKKPIKKDDIIIETSPNNFNKNFNNNKAVFSNSEIALVVMLMLLLLAVFIIALQFGRKKGRKGKKKKSKNKEQIKEGKKRKNSKKERKTKRQKKK